MDHPAADESFAGIPRACLVRRTVCLGGLFSVLFIAGCGGGGGGDSTPQPPPEPPATQITISGMAQYQSVPATPSGSLNYAAQTYKPIRGATVQLINTATGAALATAVTAASGAYSFAAVANPNAPVVVRVRAELQSTVAGGPATDVTVKDNTSGDALYVLDSTPVTVTAATQAIDVQAASGWGGSSYTGARSAAPFAVLDAIYQGVQKVRSAVPNQALPPLQVFWSTRNVPVDGVVTQGQIDTSFFTTRDPVTRAPGLRIYLLGDATTDADEYDSPVVAHEWGHYLQTAVSRDDSVGGSHSGNDRLDMRVAFSEGFGNAFAGMALGSPRYTDSSTGPQGQLRGFAIDVSSNAFTNKGWYSEDSVQYLMWTWHQDGRIGFAPMFGVLTGPMRTSGALIGIHHFAHRLKHAQASAATFIDSTLTGQNISVQDEWGTGEANAGGAAALPIYTRLLTTGLSRVCVNDSVGEPNKLRNFAYLRFANAASGRFSITVSADGSADPDPDFEVYDAAGAYSRFDIGVTPSEQAFVTLPAGEHSVVLYDYNLLGLGQANNSGERCFNVSITAQ
jgi:hypothetical protein